eukprot:SAG31_NODE_2965_length_4843_cov_7.944140_2_plen_359_part_00
MLTAMLARWVVIGALPVVAQAQPPPGNASAIFSDGNRDQTNHSWACVRGAALIRAPNSSLVAFAGGGTNCADGHVGWGILMRLSDNNGTQWSPIRTIASDATTTGGYVGPTVDRKRGQILVLYNRRFVETWLIRSTDSGATWSVPRNLTGDIGVLAIGPPGGVQLPSGRLVQAVHGAQGTAALFSDDGTSWKLGRPVGFPSTIRNGGESQLVDDLRGSNTLSMLIRVGTNNAFINHALATSDDGGETWSNASVDGMTMITGPTCQGSIARTADGRIVITAPHWNHWRYPADRRNMTAWVFERWANASLKPKPQMIQVWANKPSAYSGLLQDATFVLFEGGASYRYASVLFAQLKPLVA